MSAHAWIVMGLCFDIVGALLLSVEAVKVRNLESAIDVVVRFTQKITAIDVGESSTEKAAWVYLPTALLSGLASGSVVLLIFVAGKLTAGSSSHQALVALALVAVGLTALFLVVVAAAFILFTLTLLAEAAVAGIAIVEARTADGTIGIVGAATLVMGFSLQIVGVA